MNTENTTIENQTQTNERESFARRPLSDPQDKRAALLAEGLKSQIQERGTYGDWMSDHANAFARNENFNATRATMIIQEVFKQQNGLSANDMRLALKENEDKLFDRKNNPANAEKQQAYNAVLIAAETMKSGELIKFSRTKGDEAAKLADHLNITDRGAMRLMDEAYKDVEKRDLKEWAGELNEKYYQPQVDALKQKSRSPDNTKATKNYSRAQQQSHL